MSRINAFDLSEKYTLLIVFDCPTGVSVNSDPYSSLSN
jgi:hypothetical protein